MDMDGTNLRNLPQFLEMGEHVLSDLQDSVLLLSNNILSWVVLLFVICNEFVIHLSKALCDL